ncbi:hypothetical protein ACP72M_17820 [Vibrio cholerae]
MAASLQQQWNPQYWHRFIIYYHHISSTLNIWAMLVSIIASPDSIMG